MKYSAALVAAVAAATVGAAPTSRSTGVNTALNGQTVATWWGQSTRELSEVCDNPNFDVVMLSFLTSLNKPALNLGKNTGAASAAQKKKGWNDLFDGTVTPQGKKSVADQIKYCKSKGKKVMVSFGGDEHNSDSTFASAEAAKTGAGYVWDLFLGGTGMTDLRPFGKDVVLDGLDLDNEHLDSKFYKEFIDALKGKMGKDRKKYLLSAAPMCFTVADDSSKAPIPSSIFGDMDFMNVQFYNNPNQGIGTKGFKDNAQKWAAKIQKANPGTKLMVGMPGAKSAAPNDKVSVQSPEQIKKTIADVKSWKLPGFGGAAIWDAGFTMDNGKFADAVKGAL